jgi:N-acetylglucosamine-6-phosphate deacetylase
VSIGHSGADYDTAWAAIRAGAEAATHTMNAMLLLHQHRPAITGAVLESDVYCETICDGIHLHPGTVRLILKTKGLDRVVAITDSIMAAGLPDGRYQLGVNDVTVEGGDAKITGTDIRAGSTLTMDRALRNLVKFTGEAPETVLPLLTKNPAKLLGFDKMGEVAAGMAGDLVLLREDLTVAQTLVGGESQFKGPHELRS